jgi:hypothetical protein
MGLTVWLLAAAIVQDAEPILPKEILKETGVAAALQADKPLFLFAHSDACDVCRRTAPAVVTIFKRYAGRLAFVFYEVHGNNKPDVSVPGRFKGVGANGHHITVLQTADDRARAANRPPQPPGAPPAPLGTLDQRQEAAYASYVRAVDRAYSQYLRTRVQTAFQKWSNQEIIRERAPNNQQQQQQMARQFDSNDPAKWLKSDPFEGLQDAEAVGMILESIDPEGRTPAAPLAAVNRLSRLNLKLAAGQWEKQPLVVLSKWQADWAVKWRDLQVEAAHKEIADRIKDVTQKHPAAAAAAVAELQRLTGMDFELEAGAGDEQKRAAQKVWRDWYAESKKGLVWNELKRSFAGGAAGGAAPAGEPIDLLAKVDPARDSAEGRWQRADGGYQNGGRTVERLRLPLRPDGDYRLNVRFTRVERNNGVIIVFPVQDRQLMMVLDAGRRSGLDLVDNRTWNDDGNPTSTGDLVIENGREYAMTLTVRSVSEDEASVVVEIDGDTLIDWSGSPKTLSLRGGFGVNHPNALGLGVYQTVARFSSATLQMYGGQAVEVR